MDETKFMHSDISHRQHGVLREDKGLIDILAVLLIGGIGMTISFSGLAANDLYAYGLGIAIMIVAFGYGSVKFMREILKLIWEIQDRKKNKDK